MHLNVITTLRCNFSCRHCIFGCPVEADLDVSVFREALDGLRPHGLESVTFTGGEPLFHPDFDAMVDEVGGRGLSFCIVSNGWFHDRYEPIVARHRRRFTGFNFSLDGLDETHDDVRDAGSFQRVAAAVRRFNELGVPSTVNFVLTDRNRHELEPLEEAFEASGVLAQRHGIRIQVANSLYNPVAVEFCGVLNTDTVTLDQRGRLTLCCDIPGPASRLGEPAEPPAVQMANRARMVNDIMLDRILRARDGILTPEDQSCVYCLRYFQIMQ